MSNEEIIRFPRTEHLEDSRLGAGDSASGRVKLASQAGRWMVAEEKVDAANAGVSFPGGRMLLQSRGHSLGGGSREKQFSRFKVWAEAHEDALRAALGGRYVMYGEFMAALHTVYYDKLPHYFMEFDVFDREAGKFLSTRARQLLLKDAPVVQVPVLWEGQAPSRMKTLKALVGPSLCRSPQWRDALRVAAARAGADVERTLAQADKSEEMEGLYVKVESGGWTVDRFKWVRPSFVQAIMESGSHWADRPIVVNGLRGDVDLYAPVINWETPGITGRDGLGGYKALSSLAPVEPVRPGLAAGSRP